MTTLKVFFDEQYRPLRLLGKSERTVILYEYSIRLFGQTLGRPPTLADLNDLTVAKHLQKLLDQDRSPHGVNKERSQLLAIWRFAAQKRKVEEYPAVPTIIAPEVIPEAWTRDQLASLFRSCRRESGDLCDIPAGDWWFAIHCVLWDTGERIGALLQVRWEDLSDDWLTVQAKYRKGKRSANRIRLHERTIESFATFPRKHGLIFDWPYSHTYLYRIYNRILERAELPTNKNSKFHRMRRSVASHLHAAGGDATAALKHSSDAITRRSYLDPRIAGITQPKDILFRAG